MKIIYTFNQVNKNYQTKQQVYLGLFLKNTGKIKKNLTKKRMTLEIFNIIIFIDYL